jgi:hypothetical protein
MQWFINIGKVMLIIPEFTIFLIKNINGQFILYKGIITFDFSFTIGLKVKRLLI